MDNSINPSAEAVNYSAILTKAQAAAYLQVTPRYLNRMVASGRLKALKPSGKLWRVRRGDLGRVPRVGRNNRRCSMTALQVAKAECANCDSAGNCTGIGIADDLRCYMFREPGKCWLAPDEHGQIKRCQYFEQCVAPLAKKRAQAASSQEQQHAAASLAEGVRAYETAVMPVQTVKHAKCKRCQRTVHPPKRLCAQCAKNSTLRAKRQWWAKTRKNGALGALIANDL